MKVGNAFRVKSPRRGAWESWKQEGYEEQEHSTPSCLHPVTVLFRRLMGSCRGSENVPRGQEDNAVSRAEKITVLARLTPGGGKKSNLRRDGGRKNNHGGRRLDPQTDDKDR